MRVKRGTVSHSKHKKLFKQTKGMLRVRRSSVKKAKEATLKSLSYAYRDRRNRKRDIRSLWIIRINAGLTEFNLSYNAFINLLSKANIQLNRKMLSELAVNYPSAFKAVVETVKKSAQ